MYLLTSHFLPLKISCRQITSPSKQHVPYLIKIIFVCKSQDLKWSDSWVDLERSLPFLTWKQECAKGARGDKRSYFVCNRRSCPNFFVRRRQFLVLIRNAQTIAVVSFHPKTQSHGDAESIVGLSDRVTAVLAPVYQVAIQTCPPIWWGIALPHRCPWSPLKGLLLLAHVLRRVTGEVAPVLLSTLYALLPPRLHSQAASMARYVASGTFYLTWRRKLCNGCAEDKIELNDHGGQS